LHFIIKLTKRLLTLGKGGTEMARKFKFLVVCMGFMFLTGLIFSGPLTTGAQAKPLKIGFSMGLSGGLAAAGKAALLSMKICAEDFNKKGGVLGRPVQLVYYDDHSKPADVPAIYTKLLSVDKVDFVVGPYGTALIAPAMPIVMQNKMAFISLYGLAVNPKFNYPYYFQIMPAGPEPYTDWSKGFFEVAAEQTPKPKTVALIAVDNEYGLNGQIGAERNAKKHGMKVVYNKRFPPGTPDCTHKGKKPGYCLDFHLPSGHGVHPQGSQGGGPCSEDDRRRHGGGPVYGHSEKFRAGFEQRHILPYVGACTDLEVQRY
jgi:hypothetical protein